MHCRPGERRSESSGRHSELTASLISVNIVGNKAGPEIALVAHRPHHAAGAAVRASVIFREPPQPM